MNHCVCHPLEGDEHLAVRRYCEASQLRFLGHEGLRPAGPEVTISLTTLGSTREEYPVVDAVCRGVADFADTADEDAASLKLEFGDLVIATTIKGELPAPKAGVERPVGVQARDGAVETPVVAGVVAVAREHDLP